MSEIHNRRNVQIKSLRKIKKQSCQDLSRDPFAKVKQARIKIGKLSVLLL